MGMGVYGEIGMGFTMAMEMEWMEWEFFPIGRPVDLD
jgi:hypothetical protein